jgi:hypothetical protein
VTDAAVLRAGYAAISQKDRSPANGAFRLSAGDFSAVTLELNPGESSLILPRVDLLLWQPACAAKIWFSLCLDYGISIAHR